MSKLRLLFGVYLKGLFGINRMRHSGDPAERRKLIIYIALMPILMASLLFTAGTYCAMMAQGLLLSGELIAMPTAIFAVTSVFIFISACYKASDVLLSFKDYDMIVSLPISERTIAISRLFINYTMSLMITLLLMLPAGAVYVWYAQPAWTFYPVYLLLTLATPILPMVLGAFVSVLIKNLVARLRGARFFNMILLFGFTLLYMFVMMRMNAQSIERMSAIAMSLSDSVTAYFPPAKLFHQALVGDAGAFILLLVIYALVFCLFAWLLHKTMRKMHAYTTERRARRTFHMREMRVSSAFSALFKRELGRYFASAIYVMNTAFGPVISLILSVVLLFSGDSLLASLFEAEEMGADFGLLYALIPYLFSFMALTCCVSASSVSMEGKQIWITQSMPVRAMDVWHAKLAVNWVILLPFCVITPTVFTLVLKPALWTGVAIMLSPLVCSVFTSLFGLALNQKMHTFDWKNEAAVVKQSMPPMFCIMGGMVVSFACGALCYTFADYANLITFGYLGALTLASVLLYLSMRKNAEKRLRAL